MILTALSAIDKFSVSKDELRGYEGEASSVYFSVFDDMILQQKSEFYFDTRGKRPPLDKVNALLSFAYSMMSNMWLRLYLCWAGSVFGIYAH